MNSFILSMHVGTIDFYYFMSPSVTLTWDGGHKVSTKQGPVCFASFPYTFRLNGMKFGMVVEQFKLNIMETTFE